MAALCTLSVQGNAGPRKLQVSAPSDNAAVQGTRLAMQEPGSIDAARPVDIEAVAPGINVVRPVEVSAPAPISELPEADEFARKFLEESGLARLRPPLQPAASGDNFLNVIPYQILSWYPRIVVLPNFLDKARCEHIVQLAKNKIYPSGLAYRPGEAHDPNQQTRTSSGTFLSREEDPKGVLAYMEDKAARFTMLPVTHGEAFNVLRYQNEQHYDSHMDTFDPKEFGAQASQRMVTILFYLSDVEEGGETVFKREGENGGDRAVMDYKSCGEHEFKYKPRMGDAVLFYSLDPDLKINPRSLHGGCPVHKGEKWVATKWIHEKPIRGGPY